MEFSSTVTKESFLTVYVVPSTKVMRAAPSAAGADQVALVERGVVVGGLPSSPN